MIGKVREKGMGRPSDPGQVGSALLGPGCNFVP